MEEIKAALSSASGAVDEHKREKEHASKTHSGPASGWTRF